MLKMGTFVYVHTVPQTHILVFKLWEITCSLNRYIFILIYLYDDIERIEHNNCDVHGMRVSIYR